uniref:WAPL domain-containing protein n=1 Tax=Globodera rostochiensis TaxID=31243 RepID=A0A914I1B1_GLORO
MSLLDGKDASRSETSTDFEFEEDCEDREIAPSATKLQKFHTSCYAVYRKAGQGKQNAVRGQIQDFKHELHYVLTTIFDEKAIQNVKNLSLLQLVKKAIIPQFRNFLRSQSVQLGKLFGVLTELSSNSSTISLSASCLLYLIARDQKSVPLSENCFRLISDLLKQDSQRAKMDEEYKKHTEAIWSILKDWHRNSESLSSRPIKFNVAFDNIASPYLALEALAYTATREHGVFFKSSLLTSGCLTSIVAKFDKVVLELVHSASDVTSRLNVVERCFRILENAAVFDKKNQVFLIQHRNSLLIFSTAKFLNFAAKFFETRQSSSEHGASQNESDKIFECVCLACRVLMNISHENENASLKIGQVAGFLGNCLTLLASHFQSAPKDKFFDLCCMMYGLLVNLLERCPTNRRKFVSLKSNFMGSDGGIVADLSSIEILTKLFMRHDSAAKTIDEELDNDLVAEDQFVEEEEAEGGAVLELAEEEGSSNGLGGTKASTGHGRGQQSMSEDEIVAAIQSAMNKASAHMEDSMIASYCSLVVAILVDSDEKLASRVGELVPDGDVRPMTEQLKRFLEFMQITKRLKEGTVKNIERIITSFELAINSTG